MSKTNIVMRIGVLLITIVAPLSASALTIVECVDAQGNTSFRDSCPPGTSVKSEKQYRGDPRPDAPPSAKEIAKDFPIVVFTAPQCEACDLVTELLSKRELPFTAKDASIDPAVQAELSEITGGPLTVPLVTFGDKKLAGYNKPELDHALSSVGYP